MIDRLKHYTILYVEDDEAILGYALQYLQDKCKKIWGAKDGIEALEMYEDYCPDIIISDIKMPKLSGLDMAKRIRVEDQKTPIILATAFTDITLLLEAVELHLVKYLLKPIASKKLHEALEAACYQLDQGSTNIVQLADNTTYDLFNRVLYLDREIVKLTKTQSLLVDLLARNLHRTVSYQEIENYVWLDKIMSLDTLRTQIKALRKKIDSIEIENMSGIGYRIKAKK